jgi:hypothetical protein
VFDFLPAISGWTTCDGGGIPGIEAQFERDLLKVDPTVFNDPENFGQ